MVMENLGLLAEEMEEKEETLKGGSKETERKHRDKAFARPRSETKGGRSHASTNAQQT